MAQYYDESHRSFLTASTLGRYVRVIPSGSTANTVALAGASDRDIGVTSRQILTSGDPVDVILASHEGTHPMVASGAITTNAKVYGDANGKVTATANSNPIGFALNSAAADGDVIEVVRVAFNSPLIYSQVAAGTALTNSTTETALGSYAIPAGTLKAGDVLKIRFQGIATATNSTDSLQIKVYIGGLTGTALLTSSATDATNNDIFAGEVTVQLRTAGASGTFVSWGLFTKVEAASGTATSVNAIVASTTIDTTAAQTVAVSGTWSAASSGDSCRLDILTIEHVRA